MSIEEIILRLNEFAAMARTKGSKIPVCDGDFECLCSVIALLKTHPGAQPNEPLTLKELREMEGQPVYCQFGDGTEGWAVVELEKYPDSTPPTLFLYSFNMENSGHWEPDTDFLNLEDSGVFSSDSHFGLHCLGWRAYRRPPEEETT